MKKYLAILALTLLPACAQMGLPTAETCNQKVAVSLGAVTTARTTATTLLNAKKISADDAANVLASTDSARAGVDIARKLCASDTKGATNKLTAVTTILNAVSGYLATK